MLTKLKNKMEYSFIKMLLARINSKSPKFYIDLRYLSFGIGMLCLMIMGALKTHFLPISDALSADIYKYAFDAVKTITGVWGATFLGTTDQSLIQPPKEEEKPDTAGVTVLNKQAKQN